MPSKPKATPRISKANPFSGAGQAAPANTPAPSSIVPMEGQALALVMNELTTQRARVADLEKQLQTEQAGRREDIERLLREQADLRVKIALLEAQQGKGDDSAG